MKRTILGGRLSPLSLSMIPMAAALAIGSLSSTASALGTGLPASGVTAPRVSADPRIIDLGVAAPGNVKQFSIALTVRNRAALDAAAAAVGNPKSASFRKFITPAQFAASYGQTPDAIAQVVSFLTSQGFTVTQVHSNNLLISVKGTNAQIAATFGTSVHAYSLNGETYEAPVGTPTLPAAIAGPARLVVGLSNKANLHTHTALIPNTGALAGDVPLVTNGKGPPAAGPGGYTVVDLAAKYNIKPLYARGYTGAGSTIGIVTLAGYSQSDVFTYWAGLGLKVNPARITDVLVDGGSGDGGGQEETTLDVEQSGGVAPGANMRVYMGPNAGSGFIDVFAAAIDENVVDVLSVSWGAPEITVGSDLDTYHVLFEQAGLQGIPIIAAAGDAGAFDINRSFNYPLCTTLLSVDHPAADPAVLAAGGTTLPNTVMHRYGPVTVPTERAWGWDYLQNYIITWYGSDVYYSSYLASGGGGGVSVNFPVPSYQVGLPGVAKSAAAQSLLCDPAAFGVSAPTYIDLIDMPAGVAGRNLPDVSLNADPNSGYSVYYSGYWLSGWGGTSFVAPQINGILTLITSRLGGRIGPINQQLYAIFNAKGYSAGSPFKAISSGDNEYYKSTGTFNPATGLGSLDVDALTGALGAP
jgi:kumamolisin